jgi:pyruvate/2-oxoglutarate/acetoin dehydrogenase E1 component
MIIQEFRKFLKRNIKKEYTIFGQNITTGSRISGLTHEIEKIKSIKIYNTQNSEATLVGFGLGMMLNKKNSIYFAKQLDFLLLAMDQIVNTFNYILNKKLIGSFSIITYIVDSGFEGPQSRLHSLQEIASFSFAECTYLIFPSDIEINLKKINNNKLNIFCLSQKNFKSKENPKLINSFQEKKIFQYRKGKKGTVVAIGFSAYKALEIINKKNLDVDFYVITDPLCKLNNNLINNILVKNLLYVFDDSRSKVKNFDYIYKKILSKKPKFKIVIFCREENENKLKINDDSYKVNYEF